MTIEELKAKERSAWDSLYQAEKIVSALRDHWARLAVEREDAERAAGISPLSPLPDSAHSPAAADSQPGAVPSCSCKGNCKG